jgi:urease alpha subunit
MQAIQSATKWPAIFMRKQDQLGTVEAGKIADLVILSANPLEDIANTKKIEMVMKDGQIVDRTMHPDFAIPIPRPQNDQSQINATPRAQRMSPIIATEGDAEISLVIQGQNFARFSTVLFDVQLIPTTFVKSTELNAKIPARLLTRVGTFPVTVSSPKPGGGMSNELKFLIKFR